MLRVLRILKWVIPILLVLGVAASLHHYLPAHDVVRIVGTDVKRMDVASAQGIREDQRGSVGPTRDVRFINAVWPSGEPRVYRNEETRWGFPFYFKFDSGNLQAQAQDLVSTQAAPKWVVVTSYGWRIELFSMFPNAVEIDPAPGPDFSPFPWFNVLFLTALAALLLWLWRLVRRLRQRHIEPLVERVQGEVRDATADAEDAAEQARLKASEYGGRFRRWLERRQR